MYTYGRTDATVPDVHGNWGGVHYHLVKTHARYDILCVGGRSGDSFSMYRI